MNKLSFFLTFLILLQSHTTKTVIIQANNPVQNSFANQMKQDCLRLGFTFIRNPSNPNLITEIIAPTGTNFHPSSTGKWIPYCRQLPKVKFCNEEYKVVEYSNGTQLKSFFNKSCDEFIKTVKHENWEMIPSYIRPYID